MNILRVGGLYRSTDWIPVYETTGSEKGRVIKEGALALYLGSVSEYSHLFLHEELVVDWYFTSTEKEAAFWWIEVSAK